MHCILFWANSRTCSGIIFNRGLGCTCGRSAGGDKGAAVEPEKAIYVDKKKKDKDKQTERQIAMEKTYI